MYSLVIVRKQKIIRQESGLTKRELEKLKYQYRVGTQQFVESYT